jgi:hypothetical protein
MVAGGRLEPCAQDAEDCLTIKKQTADSAWLAFSSTQTNGHQCGDEGFAKFLDGALVYCPVGEDYAGQCVRIEVGSDALVMKRVGGKDGRDAFCGSRATVTGLVFPRKVRTNPTTC